MSSKSANDAGGTTEVAPVLDVITIGRCSVDLYGQQIGGRLEDVTSFSKSVGGCPANIAIGTARLGLRSGFVSAVGDEPMGRFIREQLRREGVDTGGLKTDSERLTALVLLGVRDESRFPLIFYRENCADAALSPDDVDPSYIAGARAIVVTGTHFARPGTDAAQRKAIAVARAHGRRVVFDIDYRPNLWGLAGHGAGEARFIASDTVTAHLRSVLPDCDLIVGTEEEFAIAGGKTDVLENLRAVRAVSAATLVLKLGPMGCVVFDGAIPPTLDGGIAGPGFPVEVYNVLGAGDAFMSGFLRAWLGGESLVTACAWANACGAFAVSRLLCSPEIPTFAELQAFLAHGSPHHALRHDAELNHIHWATTRRPSPPALLAFACDHRSQLEAMADRAGVPRDRIAAFKRLAVTAAATVAAGRPGHGMLLDATHGRDALFAAADLPHLWIARPVERPGSRPLRFEAGEDIGSQLLEWPVWQTVKVLCFYHPDDPAPLRADQERQLGRLFEACRRIGRECLIEIVAGRHGELADDTVATVLDRLYDLGIRPDWWKLEPQASAAAWTRIGAVIARRDRYCRGIVMLGQDAPEADLAEAFAAAAGEPLVKGFAVGRTMFSASAEAWFAGRIDDAAAVADMAARYARLCEVWTNARREPAGPMDGVAP
ncbi:MAG: 5-dehydro-2-deoxygluconokinase [Hyphomicrobiaceae bacterium]|nr:5-dehydro-2-deoxygluconokinase [Hyphomicrobiaceae bacterium]